MEKVIDDGEFFLPPQFLTDDEFFNDGVKATNDTKKLNDGFGLELGSFKSLFSEFGSFGLSSDLSSPVDSVLGSTPATESDEEDYLAGLTRQVALSTLENDSRPFAAENPKGWILSSSPQSPLCALPSGCGCNKQGSSRGSPNCQSRVSSPPGTWDLLYAAAGEVERLRMSEGFNNRGLLGPPAIKPSSNLDGSGFYPQPSLSQNKLRTTHLQQLQQQQLMKQQHAVAWGGLDVKQLQIQQQSLVVQNRERYGNRTLGLSPSASPPLQHQQQQPNGSGMRAVFLGNPNGKRECAGTGVFLPRVGNHSESRKKRACSTALVPARVAQALNLNLDAQPQPQHPRFNQSYTSDAAALRLRSGGNLAGNQKQRNFKPQQEISHELRLPQEWTY